MSELKTELEERDLNNKGIKSELVARLREALISEGEDPETFVFPPAFDMNLILNNFNSLKQEFVENSSKLEEKFLENSSKLDNLEEKLIDKVKQ
ncbi:hypothetical protein K1W70_25825, partial [Klebsiella pneumoniae]|uniref:SAP domain-containing protein n=1 Tax=Klebsiella pneumoniae TaxID=573 RepID=UPI001E60E48A